MMIVFYLERDYMMNLERDVKLLKIYSIAISILLIFFIFKSNTRQKFTEIDVERINVIEPNGNLKLVISNKKRQHHGIIDGKLIERKKPRGAGLIFFNYLGDETGGIQIDGGEKNGHYASLAFDKVRHDQSISIGHVEDDKGNNRVGIRVWQRPKISMWESIDIHKKIKSITDNKQREKELLKARKDGLLHVKRLFLGKRFDESVELELSDSMSRPRIKLRVDKNDTPILEFLDSNGNVTHTLPKSL
jgi:hypothetical protein